jgi:hypothetical protein
VVKIVTHCDGGGAMTTRGAEHADTGRAWIIHHPRCRWSSLCVLRARVTHCQTIPSAGLNGAMEGAFVEVMG